MSLSEQIIDEIKTYVGGLRFRPLFNSLTHYDGNENLKEHQVRAELGGLIEEKKITKLSNGYYVMYQEVHDL